MKITLVGILRLLFCIAKGKRHVVEGDFVILLISVLIVLTNFFRVVESLLFWLLAKYGSLFLVINHSVFFVDSIVIVCCCFIVPRKLFLGLTLSLHGILSTGFSSFLHPAWFSQVEGHIFYLLFAYFSSNTLGLFLIPLPIFLTFLSYTCQFIILGVDRKTLAPLEHYFIDYTFSFLTQLLTLFFLGFVLLWNRYVLFRTSSKQRSFLRNAKKFGRLLERIVGYDITKKERKSKLRKLKSISKSLRRSSERIATAMENYKPFLPDDYSKKKLLKLDFFEDSTNKSLDRNSTNTGSDSTSTSLLESHKFEEAAVDQNAVRNKLSSVNKKKFSSPSSLVSFSSALRDSQCTSNMRKIDPSTCVCVHFFKPDAIENDEVWYDILPRLFLPIHERIVDARAHLTVIGIRINHKFSSEKVHVLFYHPSMEVIAERETVKRTLASEACEFALKLRHNLEEALEKLNNLLDCKIHFGIGISSGIHFSGILGLTGRLKMVEFGRTLQISSILARYSLFERMVNIGDGILIDRATDITLNSQDFLKIPICVLYFPQFRDVGFTVVSLLKDQYEGRFYMMINEEGEKVAADGHVFQKDEMVRRMSRISMVEFSDVVTDEEYVYDLVDVIWDLVESNRADECNRLIDLVRQRARKGEESAETVLQFLKMIWSVVKAMDEKNITFKQLFEEKNMTRKLVFGLDCVPFHLVK